MLVLEGATATANTTERLLEPEIPCEFLSNVFPLSVDLYKRS